MKILFITNGYPSGKYVRNGIFAYDQAKSLVKAEHEVLCIGADIRSIRRWRKWGIENKKVNGVQYIILNLPVGRIPKSISNKIMVWATRIIMKRALKDFGTPDVIHSHYLRNGYVLTELFKDSDVPLIHTEHSSRMNEKQIDKYFFELGKKVYRNVDLVFSVSSALAHNIYEKFGVQSIVIPNIVDSDKFRYIPSKKTTDEFKFISVGSLLEIKRMDLLIEIFSKTFKSNPKVKLYIYGEGPERKKLESLIIKNAMNNQIYLMGEVNRSVIAEKMKTSDAFVIASRRETFGVAVIEALASGLPVISTMSGGPEDLIDDDNGLLVEVSNSDQLKEALNYMYSNHSKFNREKISQMAIKKYNPENVAKLLTHEYLRLKI